MFLWMGEEIEERRQKYQAEALFPPFVRAMTTERDDDDDATRYRRSSDGVDCRASDARDYDQAWKLRNEVGSTIPL